MPNAADDHLPMPTIRELLRVARLRNGPARDGGWEVRMRRRFGYFAPDDYYEAILDRLIVPGMRWLDVGCGRHLLPHNPRLARDLVGRCGLLVGVDPDPTLEENPFVHRRVRQTLDAFRSEDVFDIATLRMVAEHIQRPAAAMANLAQHMSRGGLIVIFTVHRWSPASIVAGLTPHRWHHAAKRFLWGTEERDTFPVAYKMNTLGRLSKLFETLRFRPRLSCHLADCRLFTRFRLLHWLELSAWRCCHGLGLWYPESCLLSVCERCE